MDLYTGNKMNPSHSALEPLQNIFMEGSRGNTASKF